MTKLRPYVGVAGFMSSAEIMAAIETLPQDPTHNLAIGILASAKTFDGHTHSKPSRYPQEGGIEKIVRQTRSFSTRPLDNVEFILHMAIDPKRHIGNQIGQATSLIREAELDGIQINASPHVITTADVISAVGAAMLRIPRIKRVIMQLRPPRDTEPFIDMIQAGIDIATSRTATDILIDASAGAGIPLNVTTASIMIAGIRGASIDRHRVGIGVAGGLRADSLAGVAGLMEVHGPLSFDVESGVRDEQDRMDVARLRSYLYQAWRRVRAE